MTSSEREDRKRKLQQELADIEAEENAEKERVSVLLKLPSRYRDLFSGCEKWTQERFDTESVHFLTAINNVLPVLAQLACTSSTPNKKVAKKVVAKKLPEPNTSTSMCFICDNPVCTCDSIRPAITEPVNIVSHSIRQDSNIQSDLR